MKRCLESFALHLALAAGGACCVLLRAPLARAQEPRPALSLDWSAPPECPTAAQARRLVADYLGQAELRAPSSGARVLGATATIRHRGERWELKLQTELDGEPGERTLAAATCTDVAAAGALVLAFAIDPGAALRHAEPRPAPASPRAPEPPKPLKSVARAPLPPVTSFGVAGTVFGDFGALPRPSAGLALSLVVERGVWSGMLSGAAFAPRSRATAVVPSAGGTFSLFSVAAAPCLSPAYAAALRVHACLPFEWQRLRAAGYGVDHPANATRSELLVAAELLLGFRLSPRLELIVPLRLGVALVRPEFYLEGIDSVFRASALQGRVGIGLLARF